MNTADDVRWVQRFQSFNKAFLQLERFINKNEINEMEQQGLIKAFEYTFELAWKTLQDLLKAKGYTNIIGPKPVIQQGFEDGYINDGKGWLKMHGSRNLTSHTYNEETAEEIIESIRNDYFLLFRELREKLEEERSNNKETGLWNDT